MENYSREVASKACQKLIQDLFDGIRFSNPVDAGQTLGTLIMLATQALDQVMGSEYACATIVRVSELMSTGEPQKRTHVEMIKRSDIN